MYHHTTTTHPAVKAPGCHGMRGMSLLIPIVLLMGTLYGQTTDSAGVTEEGIMELTSTAFGPGELIPSRYTCDGEDLSPTLAWSGVPDSACSLLLIVDDPDAPGGTWVHWVLYDLPPDGTGLPEGVTPEQLNSWGAAQGRNSWGRNDWGEPCPPSGTHRYYFKLYALDTKLGLDPGATKQEVLDAAKNYVLAQGELMGRYRRGG